MRFSNFCWSSLRKPSFGETEDEGGFVENSHDDGFAVNGGDRRHPEINRVLPDFDLDAAVLRESLLGDGHRARHDLEAGDDGGLKFLRRGLHLLQDTVDAKADAERLLHWLQVDVGRATFVGFEEKAGDHLDDGCVALAIVAEHHVFGRVVPEVVGGAVVLAESLIELFGRGADEFDFPLEKKSEAIERFEGHWVVDGDGDGGVGRVDWNGVVAAGVLGGEDLGHVRRDHDRVEIDEIHAAICGEGAGDVFVAEETGLNERVGN